MTTIYKYHGKRVTVVHTMHGYEAQTEGEPEPRRIDQGEYMRLVLNGTHLQTF